MPEFQIERFYETMLNSNAAEGWLLAGQSPVLRIEHRMRKLEIPKLTSNDILNLMQSVAGTENMNLYSKHGIVDFPVIFSDRGITLQVSVVNNAGRCFVLFRAPLSTGTSATTDR
jgi:Tfp pilus assembly pilus retraction ATPase PilT